MKVREIFKSFVKSPHKIIFSSLFSVITSLLFAIYNIYLGLSFNDALGISIAIYYACLIIARIIALNIERKIRNCNANIKDNVRRKAYLGLSLFMFFIDLSLIAPITLMIIHPKTITFGIIPSITVATYTTYKIIMAIFNYQKSKKFDNLTYKFLRELSLIDALISVLSLQHTLIMVNGGMSHDMKILSACSSFGILSFIIIFSICVMIHNLKQKMNNN
ncbi:MAG: hypothetical protein ACI4TX_02335 [Christensenellales bacterium]